MRSSMGTHSRQLTAQFHFEDLGDYTGVPEGVQREFSGKTSKRPSIRERPASPGALVGFEGEWSDGC